MTTILGENCWEYPQPEQPRCRLLVVAETLWAQHFPHGGSMTSFTSPAFAHVRYLHDESQRQNLRADERECGERAVWGEQLYKELMRRSHRDPPALGPRCHTEHGDLTKPFISMISALFFSVVASVSLVLPVLSYTSPPSLRFHPRWPPAVACLSRGCGIYDPISDTYQESHPQRASPYL